MGGKKIDAITRKFLWNRVYKEETDFFLVNWKRVCMCKKFGGLGIINLRDFNTALLLKWWWRLLMIRAGNGHR